MKEENKKSPGGMLVGLTDKDGGKGIKVIAPEGNIIMGGAETVIVSDASKAKEKYEFEGEKKTPCEILSDINHRYGGVKIPCDIAEAANTTDSKMEVGDVIKNKNKMEAGGITEEEKNVLHKAKNIWLQKKEEALKELRNRQITISEKNRYEKLLEEANQHLSSFENGSMDGGGYIGMSTTIPYTDFITGTKGEIDLTKSREYFGKEMAKAYAEQNNKRVTPNVINSFTTDAGAYHRVRDLLEDVSANNFSDVVKVFKELYPKASDDWKSALRTGLVIKAGEKEGNYSNGEYIYTDKLAERIRDAGSNFVNPIIEEILSGKSMKVGGKINEDEVTEMLWLLKSEGNQKFDAPENISVANELVERGLVAKEGNEYGLTKVGEQEIMAEGGTIGDKTNEEEASRIEREELTKAENELSKKGVEIYLKSYEPIEIDFLVDKSKGAKEQRQDIQKFLIDSYLRSGLSIINKFTGFDISFGREGIKKLSYKAGEMKINTLFKIEEVIRRGILYNTVPDNRKREEILAVLLFVVVIKYENELFEHRFTVKQYADGHFLYSTHADKRNPLLI